MRDLGTLDGRRSQAKAINDRAQINGEGEYGQAFVWQAGTMIDLARLPGRPRAVVSAKAINAEGYIVGTSSTRRGTVSHVYRALLWVPQ